MNLILLFIHPSHPPRTLGPIAELWIDQECLRDRCNGPVLARHVRHQWEIEGVSYYRLDCTASVYVRFEGGRGPPSKRLGPFNRFSAVDGLAYTNDKVFAYLDGKVSAWLCYDLGRHWPMMIVTEATAGSTV